MADNEDNALAHPEVKLGSTRDYGVAYLLSILLSGLSLGLVYGRAFPHTILLGVISAIAFVTVSIQIYFFINLDVSPTQRWKTISTAFIVPLIALMIGLTIWMFYTLQLRTMVPGIVGH